MKERVKNYIKKNGEMIFVYSLVGLVVAFMIFRLATFPAWYMAHSIPLF